MKLIEELQEKIKFKVNGQKRQLNNLFIDFGAFPMLESWTSKNLPDLNMSAKETNRKDLRS